MMEVDEVPNENVKVAVADFSALPGDTYNEKKKCFREFLKNLNLSSQELDEFGNHLLANKPCALSVAILLHFKMHGHVMEVIRSNNGPLVGRILKDWRFFKNVFSCVTPEELVNNVLPLLSFTIRMKVVNRICKTLTDEVTADCLFELLEDKFGISTASVVIPVCSVTFIKSKIVKYELKLSDRQLWSIYKKDSTFVEYYFDYLLDVTKSDNFVTHAYKQLIKRVFNTNATVFWTLVEKYKIPFTIGKYSSKKILINRDVLLKYVTQNNSTVTFSRRQTYRASIKLGIQKEYLLTFYPDNSSDFLSTKLTIVPSLQKFVPKCQRFALTNSLFNEKYADDLLNYPNFFRNFDLLERLTVSERKAILDKLEDDTFFYFYNTDISVPILVEKLKSASDINIRARLITTLFKSCNVNKDKDTLLMLLNLLYNRYRNDTPVLQQFMNSELITWKNFRMLEQEHWDVINNIVVYLEHSNTTVFYTSKNTYIEEYFTYLVDNNGPLDEFMEKFIIDILDNGLHFSMFYKNHFGGSAKHKKIFYEKSEQFLKLKRNYKNYNYVVYNLLENIVNFDMKYPGWINVPDYFYILDVCNDRHTNYDSTFLHILNKYNYFHENMKNYYFTRPNAFSIGFFKYCINKSPKELFNVNNIYSIIPRFKINIPDLLNCPYLKNSLPLFKENALQQLNTNQTNMPRDLMKFLSMCDENEFVNYIERFNPPEDGKITPDFDKQHLEIQKSSVNCLPLISYPRNITILLKYCKGDYLKFALPSLYKLLFRTPNIHVEDFLRNMYKSAVSVRKHSLCLGRHLLSPNSFGQFLDAVNNEENNLSMRFIFLKKAREYFIEMHDDKFYNLFMENLNKIDDKDHSVFDYISKYSKIPQSYLLDYIKNVCQKISINSDKDIKRMKFTLINSLPDYLFENLDAGFITWCFEEDFFEIMPFVIKCLFYSKCDNHQLIFNRFNTFLSGDVRSQNPRANISRFVQTVCEKSLERKAVDKFAMFYSNCQRVFPKHCLINDRFLMEFTQIWFESHADVKQFALKMNKYLIDTLKLYPHGVMDLYCDKLKYFIRKANMNKFEFVQNFFYANSSDETCVATINLLPNIVPSIKNAFHMYIPLLEDLEKINTPVVLARLDLYYGRAH